MMMCFSSPTSDLPCHRRTGRWLRPEQEGEEGKARGASGAVEDADADAAARRARCARERDA